MLYEDAGEYEAGRFRNGLLWCALELKYTLSYKKNFVYPFSPKCLRLTVAQSLAKLLRLTVVKYR